MKRTTCFGMARVRLFKDLKYVQSKKGGKYQESIQLSTTPDPGYQLESDNFTIRHPKREPRGHPPPTPPAIDHMETINRRARNRVHCIRIMLFLRISFVNFFFFMVCYFLKIFELTNWHRSEAPKHQTK